MQSWITVCNILGMILGGLYAYRIIFGIVGLFCSKRFSHAKRFHKYAVVVAARNEAAVIGNLLDSIRTQDYPSDHVTVFVVADNCTDNTAEVARRHGAICYERFDSEHVTKGYALQFLFEKIEQDFGRDRFEGYFVFDADNLLKSDYISRMNDAFDSGERVVVSYRNTKNLGDGWLSASYALHWVRTCRLEHCARSFFGISARIQGTGFLFGSEFVKDGWRYTSLTEDRAFSSDIVSKGIAVSYQHEAVFYDEQPTSIGIAMRQRLRWAKGNLQAFVETGKALFLGIFTQKSMKQRISCYDMLLFNFPSSVLSVPLKIIEAAIVVAMFITAGRLPTELAWLTWRVFYILIFEHFTCIGLGFLVFFLERKRLLHLRPHQYFLYSLMFPMFGIIGDIVMLGAVFLKVTWKPIPHNADIKIGQIEADAAPAELHVSKSKQRDTARR